MAQSFVTYLLLFNFSFFLHFYKNRWLQTCNSKYCFYILVSLADVEANYLLVKAYQFTNIASVTILDSFAIPSAMLFSYIFLKVSFHYIQYIGVAICLLGVGLVVTADFLAHDKSQNIFKVESAWRVLIGDCMVLAGATLYGISNVCQELTGFSFSFLGCRDIW